jgi:hypothetical protein
VHTLAPAERENVPGEHNDAEVAPKFPVYVPAPASTGCMVLDPQ